MQSTPFIQTVVRNFPETAEKLFHQIFFPGHAQVLETVRGEFDRRVAAGAAAVFVHTPRCAGSSMRKALPDALTHSHFSAGDYRLLLGRDGFERCFKFGFVRNPWDRLVSSFFHLKRGGDHANDKAWADRHMARYDHFEDFVSEWLTPANAFSDIWHFVPMTRFVCLPGDARPALDFLGRYETLAEDFAAVAARLGLGATLERVNATPRDRSDYRDYYTPKTRRIVERVYRSDLHAFGYEF